MSQAFKAGHDVVRPVKPHTIAKSLAIGNPADGPYVLDVARRTGGAVEDVTDEEVREGIRLLGTSGTVTTLASVHLALPFYDRRAVDGLHVPIEAM